MNHKLLPKVIFVFIFFVLKLLYFHTSIVEASVAKSLSVTATADVPGKYLSISGIIAPFASVVLLSNDIVLRGTVADQNGKFSISQVLIATGTSSICLDAIDYKSYGESYTCINITPITQDTVMNNIFLPPTLGFEQTQVVAGNIAIARGYGMPGANITIHSSLGNFTVTADKNGYYSISIPVPNPGAFEFFADSVYNGNKSLTPARKIILVAIASATAFLNTLKNLLIKIVGFIFGNPWGVVLVIIPIIILIIILLRKLKPEWFTTIDGAFNKIANYLPFIKRKLHHAWFVGY